MQRQIRSLRPQGSGCSQPDFSTFGVYRESGRGMPGHEGRYQVVFKCHLHLKLPKAVPSACTLAVSIPS